MAAAVGVEDTPLGHMLSTEGNRNCADCEVPIEDDPWASINLGILLCIKCSGLHRQLGTHISKVRSPKLDTKVWEDENLVAHMCSIGNKAFNTVWEWNVPPEFIRPQEFPDDDKVREAFIFAKYKDRAFFRNEVTAMQPSESVAGGNVIGPDTEGFPIGGSAVHFSGQVLKLSGGTKMFGAKKWDQRTLQLAGTGELKYLKGSEVKGTIPLDGASVTLLPDEEYANKPNCFAVKASMTGSGSKGDGRRFDFHCDGGRDVGGRMAVTWAQRLRFALSTRSTPIAGPQESAFGATIGIPNCQLGQVVDQLVGHAKQWVDTSTLHGPVRCKQLGAPNDIGGAWHDRIAVLTPWAFYCFAPVDSSSTAADLDKPTCCIPLQAAEVVDSPRLLPTGAKGPHEDSSACRFAITYPLGYCAISMASVAQANEFVKEVKAAAQKSQEQAGGKL